MPEAAKKASKEAERIKVNPKAFKKMRRLQLLKLWNVNISDGLRYFPNKL